MDVSFFIAKRYLQQRTGAFSSFIIKLAVIATALSVSVMIIAMAVVTGFNYVVREKLFSFTGHVHVVLFDASKANSLTPEPIYFNRKILDSLKSLPHVTQVFPFAQRPVIVQAKGTMEGLKLKGVNNNYRLPTSIKLDGKLIDYSDSNYSKQIILSQTTANKLNVITGDTIQLDFLQPNSLPRIRKVKIAGIFHTGMEEIDKNFGLCDIRLLQRMNNWSADSINGYQIELDDEHYSDYVAEYIHYNIISAPLEAYTTTDNYSFIFDWLELQSINGRILLIIMSIVSIINMGAVLVILMVDRAAMIGLLKALGMTYQASRKIFLGMALLIGMTGVIIGNIFALIICWAQEKFGIITLSEDIYYMKYAPVKIVWWQIALIDVCTVFLCVLCTWLPALYIRKIQPAKVLQFK